jgi:hypothetical protein
LTFIKVSSLIKKCINLTLSYSWGCHGILIVQSNMTK